ncbi:MAG: hypothetical protein K0R85_2103 [Devosia sp.]|jgi:hypothetical protein|nr:hypothetical protein [Devosia sp.]
MPRYFFDVAAGDDPFVDNEGSELLDDEAAIREALLFLAERGREFIPQRQPPTSATLRVREDSGRLVAELTLSLTIRRPPADYPPD